jgi:predicted SAM-dependent methyltransferase
MIGNVFKKMVNLYQFGKFVLENHSIIRRYKQLFKHHEFLDTALQDEKFIESCMHLKDRFDNDTDLFNFIVFNKPKIKKVLPLISQSGELKLRSNDNPLRIVLGASNIYDNGWIPLEIDNLDVTKEDDWKELFALNTLDALLAEHVWEHLTPADAIKSAQNSYRFLKAGGYCRIAVPDGYHPDPQYINLVKPGGSGCGSDDHKVLYTYNTLSNIFLSAGFKVNLIEFFDEGGNFHSIYSNDLGTITRSSKNDDRNESGKLNYTSLIIDAIKVKQ